MKSYTMDIIKEKRRIRNRELKKKKEIIGELRKEQAFKARVRKSLANVEDRLNSDDEADAVLVRVKPNDLTMFMRVIGDEIFSAFVIVQVEYDLFYISQKTIII